MVDWSNLSGWLAVCAVRAEFEEPSSCRAQRAAAAASTAAGASNAKTALRLMRPRLIVGRPADAPSGRILETGSPGSLSCARALSASSGSISASSGLSGSTRGPYPVLALAIHLFTLRVSLSVYADLTGE
jgi:hypothetical protein